MTVMMAGTGVSDVFGFDPSVLLVAPYTDEKVVMLDILVAIMYSQSLEVLMRIPVGTPGITPPNPATIQQLMMNRSTSREIIAKAHEIMNQIKELPESWRFVDLILAKSQNSNAKFFALNILELCIKTRWALPDLPREAIRDYVTDLVIRISSSEETAERERAFLKKLNEVLVLIVNYEWPHNWPSFLTDICGASRKNQFLCENNMTILATFTENIHEFGEKTMVSSRVNVLKASLEKEFKSVVELCIWVFDQYVRQPPGTIKPSLINKSLETLAKFLNWISLRDVFTADAFGTNIVYILFNHFWDPPQFRIESLKCLNEIATRDTTAKNPEDVLLFRNSLRDCFIATVQKVNQLPQDHLQLVVENGPQREYWRGCVNQIALLLSSLLKQSFDDLSQVDQNFDALQAALQYLIKVTELPDEEIFKICVETWEMVAGKLYQIGAQCRQAENQDTGMMHAWSGDQARIHNECSEPRLAKFSHCLSQVRELLITKMVKPPEVTIRENEEGHIVRQGEEDTDEINLYKMMKGLLVYLTHLNPENMDQLMLSGLRQETRLAQESHATMKWSPTNLNRLCYAIGSISGSLSENHEKRFLVSVIKDLLSLCDMKRGKENKACVASNIMYVVGAYPSFLRAHWRFLKTVVHKLIEFMHETFPGVQEMSVDTFLRITQKCKKKFVFSDPSLPPTEQGPFIKDLITSTEDNIRHLTHLGICTYYEAIGMMIACAPKEQKEQYIDELMRIFNEIWQLSVSNIQLDGGRRLCEDIDALKKISLFLRLNERVAVSTGLAFTPQLRKIYHQSLQFYKLFSMYISSATVEHGANAIKLSHVKQMRTVKRDCLRLVRTYLKTCIVKDDPQQQQQAVLEYGTTIQQLEQEIATFIVPPLLEPVIQDYCQNVPEARDAEVLELLATMVQQLSQPISSEIPKIFEMIVETTLRMLEADMQEFPDHRLNLYKLIGSINRNCFQSIFLLTQDKLTLYINTLLWGVKHDHPAVSERALNCLVQFLQNLGQTNNNKLKDDFFGEYFYPILDCILQVLTDTMHTGGHSIQMEILCELILYVEGGGSQPGRKIGKNDAMQKIGHKFLSSFDTLQSEAQVEAFVLGLFNKCRDAPEFVRHVNDFLIQIKAYGGPDVLWKLEREEALRQQQVNEQQQRSLVPGLVYSDPNAQSIAALRRDEDDL